MFCIHSAQPFDIVFKPEGGLAMKQQSKLNHLIIFIIIIVKPYNGKLAMRNRQRAFDKKSCCFHFTHYTSHYTWLIFVFIVSTVILLQNVGAS